MNKLSKFLKKLRFENDEVLFDMAKRLGVSSAFLSAVENDRKSFPLPWFEVIVSEYQLDNQQKRELEAIIAESVKQVRMDVGAMSANKRNCALAFARSFDGFSDEDIEGLMSFIEKRRN